MEPNSIESHRKHRLSPFDDNSPDNSKRRRHHHHHHHRSHRSKHEEQKRDELDMEEGEIVDNNYLDDHHNMKDDASMENGHMDLGRSGDHKNYSSHGSLDESPKSGSAANIDRKKRSHGRSKSPSKSSGKRKYKHSSGHDESYERSRSKSDQMRERERSQSILHERRSRSRHHHERDEGIYENAKVCDHGLDITERTSDNRSERSSSRHRSSKLENGESLDRKRKEVDREVERDIDPDRKHEREEYHGRSRDMDYERKRRRDGSTSSYRNRNGEKESDRKLDMDGARDNSYRGRDKRDGETDVETDGEAPEVVEVKLAEQQEDDVESIKEKSRRIREAILEKHKAKQSQLQVAPQDAKAETNEKVAVTSFDVEKSPLRNEMAAVESSIGAVELGKGSPKSERSNDMFCHDMFADSPAGIRNTGKGDGLPVERSGLNDNWDDPEGYYSFRLGEILDSRYEIMAAHGKGVFSTVVRAKDLKAGSFDPEEVAIKIIRNNETMLKAGTDELVILKKLVDTDPDDRRHCVRYLSHFKYRNHLCIVFESLHMNLREVQKKFGRNIGLKLTAVRAYAKQLFIALNHLRNCGVLHCDIKPDNMLVNDAKTVLKLCDFGNAMLAGKNEITPYLVSRFYRAPEIILGLPYDHPLDIWSVGCCLYELYTGRVLFPGATNNDMLRLHMELKGSFPKKMLRKGAFIEPHFDQDKNFLATEEDPVTKKAIRRLICNIKPKNIGTIIKGSPGEDPKMLTNFKDLLDKIFVLDPEKRPSVLQALNHPFIAGK